MAVVVVVVGVVGSGRGGGRGRGRGSGSGSGSGSGRRNGLQALPGNCRVQQPKERRGAGSAACPRKGLE